MCDCEWQHVRKKRSGGKNQARLKKEAIVVLDRASGSQDCKARQHASQAGPGQTCVHPERACTLESAGKKVPHTFAMCRDGQAAGQRWAGGTRMCSLLPGLMGVGLLESISVSWGPKT